MTTITIEAAIQDLQKWLSGNCGCQLRCEAGPDAKDPDFITYVADLTIVNEEDGTDEQMEVGSGDTLADALIALLRSAGGHPYDAYRASSAMLYLLVSRYGATHRLHVLFADTDGKSSQDRRLAVIKRRHPQRQPGRRTRAAACQPTLALPAPATCRRPATAARRRSRLVQRRRTIRRGSPCAVEQRSVTKYHTDPTSIPILGDLLLAMMPAGRQLWDSARFGPELSPVGRDGGVYDLHRSCQLMSETNC